MSEVYRLYKPVTAVGTAVIVFSYAVMKYTDRIPLIVVGAVIFCVISAVLLKNEVKAIVLVCVMTALSISLSYLNYALLEKKALELISKYEAAENLESAQALADVCSFEGEVLDFSSNNSFCFMDVKLSAIAGEKTKIPYKARIWCYSSDYACPGDTVYFSGKPVSVYQLENDGFDTVTYLRSKKIFIAVPDAEITGMVAGKSLSVINRVRAYIENTLLEYLPRNLDFTTCNVAKALVLGERSGLDDDVKNDFTRSGILHLLCVSGMHLSIILGFVFAVFRGLTFHKKLSSLLVIAVCVFYVVLTGMGLSAVRAGIMSLCTYIAIIIGRRADAVVSLFVSASIMCIINPYTVLSISAQLSFFSTFAIAVCLPVLKKDTIFSRVLSALAVNMSAACFTLPLSAFAFGGISVFSVFATFFASVLCEASLILIVVTLLFSPIGAVGLLSQICVFLSELCNLFINAMIDTARFFSNFRYAYVPYTHDENIWLTMFLAAAFVVAMLLCFGKDREAVLVCISIVVMSVVYSVIALIMYIDSDKNCEVWYYRKSAEDTQISIKLSQNGALIINNDSVLCTDPEKAYFDGFSGKNFIYIIPDESIVPEILAHNIKVFDARFGVCAVYVADVKGAWELCRKLRELGVNAEVLSLPVKSGDIVADICAVGDTGVRITVSDAEKTVCIVISDRFDAKDFEGFDGINAYFTCKTENQFDALFDEQPDGELFYTRTQKDADLPSGVVNTYGKASVRLY